MNKLVYIFFGLIIGLVSSCYKDLGNYDYVDINEVNIGSLGGPYKLLYKADTLRINPVLEFTQDNSEDRFVYEWRIGKVNEPIEKRPLIGSERNLAYHINVLPGSYTIYYNVYDKVTDVTWSSLTTLEVSTNVSKGFFLTGEDENGFADADFVSMPVGDTIIMKRIMKDNGMPRYKNPIATIHTGTIAYAGTTKLWFLTGEGGYFMNTSNYTASPANTFQRLVFSTLDTPADTYPIDVAPQVNLEAGAIAGVAARLILTNKGDVYASNVSTLTDFYGNPVNRLSARPDEKLKCAPYLMYPASRMEKFIVFDEINNRFLMGTAGTSPGTFLTVLGDANQNPFPWNQGTTGRKLHYAENTKNIENGGSFGNTYALMKDDNNEFHIYKFYATGLSLPTKLAYHKITEVAQDIDKATLFAFSSTQKLLFYAVGSKLYAYNYNPGLEKLYLIQDYGDEITMIKCDIQQGNGSQVYVATYNEGTKGTIHKYLTGTNPNNLIMTKVNEVDWTGLVKVKSMTWRNSTQ